MLKRRKITVVGAGYTGATTSLLLAQKELGDLVLLDVEELEEPTKGKALDMLQAGPLQGFNVNIVGTSDYCYTKDSDIVVITAGISRKVGMSREDLINTNAKIIRQVTAEIVSYSKECIIIVLTNPVDVMTYEVFKVANFPRNRVIGQAGVLDTARFATFIALELNVAMEDVTSIVLGGHGDKMLPLIRYSYVGGIPLTEFLPKQKIDEIVERTRKGGGEIVSLLKNGSAYYAPAAAICQMVEAILQDKRRILPAVSLLAGEYGVSDLCIGVPVILGKNGIEKVLELKLTKEEAKCFQKSVAAVRNAMSKI